MLKKVLKYTFFALLGVAAVSAATLCAAGIYLNANLPPAEAVAQTETAAALPKVAAETTFTLDTAAVVGVGGSEGAVGSGVIATQSGYILTSRDIIADLKRIYVTFSSGEREEAKLLWSDKNTRLALIRVYDKTLSPAQTGSSRLLRAGDGVSAVGSNLKLPFRRSVTRGVVCALEDDGSIAIDAQISDTGGALLNARGETVGIIIDASGIAAPIDIAKAVIAMFESRGAFETPDIGIGVISAAAARYQKQDFTFPDGVFVAELSVRGAAFAAGLRYGDIITSIDGNETPGVSEFYEALYARQSGEMLNMRYTRLGARLETDILVGEKNHE